MVDYDFRPQVRTANNWPWSAFVKQAEMEFLEEVSKRLPPRFKSSVHSDGTIAFIGPSGKPVLVAFKDKSYHRPSFILGDESKWNERQIETFDLEVTPDKVTAWIKRVLGL